MNEEWVEARISISLPARGRTILGGQALGIFFSSLPFVVQNALQFNAYDYKDVSALSSVLKIKMSFDRVSSLTVLPFLRLTNRRYGLIYR